MRTPFKHTMLSTAALALFAIVPATLTAQEAEQQAQCTAEVSSGEIEAGQKAVQVTVALSAPVGSDVEFMAARESGVALANPADIPRSEMAAEEEEAPQPIQLSAEGGSEATLWLNTENAQPGTYDVALRSGESACAGQLTISGGPAG